MTISLWWLSTFSKFLLCEENVCWNWDWEAQDIQRSQKLRIPRVMQRDDGKMKSQGMPFWSWPGCSLSWSKEASAWGRGWRRECSIDFHSGLEMPVFIACALTFLADCNLWFLSWFSWNKQLVTHTPAGEAWIPSGCRLGGMGSRGGLEPFPLHSLPDMLLTAPLIDPWITERWWRGWEWVIAWWSIFMCPPTVTSMGNF